MRAGGFRHQRVEADVTYREPSFLMHNSGGKECRFADVTKNIPDMKRPIVGRGLAVGDFDNDGKMDILIVDSEGAPLLMHNETITKNHWLGVKLVGTKCNRDGYGATVTVKIGNRSIMRHCHADGSYLSSSDPRVLIGIGNAAKVDSMVINWPDGTKQIVKQPEIDRYVEVREK